MNLIALLEENIGKKPAAAFKSMVMEYVPQHLKKDLLDMDVSSEDAMNEIDSYSLELVSAILSALKDFKTTTSGMERAREFAPFRDSLIEYWSSIQELKELSRTEHISIVYTTKVFETAEKFESKISSAHRKHFWNYMRALSVAQRVADPEFYALLKESKKLAHRSDFWGKLGFRQKVPSFEEANENVRKALKVLFKDIYKGIASTPINARERSRVRTYLRGLETSDSMGAGLAITSGIFAILLLFVFTLYHPDNKEWLDAHMWEVMGGGIGGTLVLLGLTLVGLCIKGRNKTQRVLGRR